MGLKPSWAVRQAKLAHGEPRGLPGQGPRAGQCLPVVLVWRTSPSIPVHLHSCWAACQAGKDMDAFGLVGKQDDGAQQKFHKKKIAQLPDSLHQASSTGTAERLFLHSNTARAV